MEIEESGRRVQFLRWCQIYTWITDTSSMMSLVLDSCLNQNLFFLSLCVSISPYSLLHSLSNPTDPSFSHWSQPIEQSKFSPKIFPPHLIAHPKYKQLSRNNSSVGRDTFQHVPCSNHSSHCQIFSYTLATFWVLQGLCSQSWLRDQNIFNYVNLRALTIISFPAAEHTWMIIFSGFAGEVDIWTHVCGF